MSLSSTQSTVADYFFVTGLRDVDLFSTYDKVKRGLVDDIDAGYYNNMENCAASTAQSQTQTQLNSTETKTSTKPEPILTTTKDNNHQVLSTNGPGRKRGQSLPVLPTISDSNTTTSSNTTEGGPLIGVMDHVQAVIDHFDKERDFARGTVISIAASPSHDSTTTSLERSRRASINTGYINGSKRPSLHDTSWQRVKDSITSSVKRTHTQRRQRQYSKSNSSADINNTLQQQEHQDQQEPKVQLPNPLDEKPTSPHLLDVKYPPTVLMRYPSQDSINPFPSYLPMFSFPHDISLHYGDEPPPEKIHSFAMTDDTGTTRYGTCCIFYEPLLDTLMDSVDVALKEWINTHMTTSTVEYGQHLQEKIESERIQLEQHISTLVSETNKPASIGYMEWRSQLEEQIRMSRESLALYNELLEPVKLAICTSKQIWVPKSVGVLGRMPWLDLYGDWIKILLDSVVGVRGKKNKDLSVDIGSIVANLIHEVPVPPPGRFEIGLNINDRPLYISRPAMNEVPLLKNFSLYPLFRALSPHLILAVLENLLAEGKVIFLSQYCGMLSLACESFRYLLFPFYWQFVFIPLLPERLLNCLQAPVPYIIGVQGCLDDIDEFFPDDACIVNLDSNTIHQSPRVPMLPDRQRRKLQSSIEQYCPLHNRCRVPYGVPLSVQMAFPNGRLLLSCNRSKLQDVFETPASRNRISESSDTSSLWSGSKIGWQLPRSSAIWNDASSTRSSNESILSQSIGTPDHSQQGGPPPQLSNFTKLAVHPQTSPSSSTSIRSSSNTNTSPVSPTHPGTSSNNRPSSEQRQRSSMPTTPKLSHPQSTAQNGIKDHGVSSLCKPQNSMSEPPLSRVPTPMEDGVPLVEGGIMSKPKAAFQHISEQPRISLSSTYSPSLPSTVSINTTASSAMNYESNGSYDHYYQHQGGPHEVGRHIKHIEGHIMVTLFSQELSSFQGHRCLCGKHVDQGAPIQELYRICHECHLVTHDSCADQILHPCLPACFDEIKIQDALLRMFASLLYGYRSGFMDSMEHPVPPNSSVLQQNRSTAGHPPQKSMYFSKKAFLRHSDKDTRAYLSTMAGSQMFTQFITDRLNKPKTDPEILMFDEFIKLKRNRSKLKFVKEETPFLNDDSYRVSQVIWATPPENQRGQIYDRFPIDPSTIF